MSTTLRPHRWISRLCLAASLATFRLLSYHISTSEQCSWMKKTCMSLHARGSTSNQLAPRSLDLVSDAIRSGVSILHVRILRGYEWLLECMTQKGDTRDRLRD